METIKHTRVRLIAVDEAHCISEWGQAFRPDYLKGSIQSSPVFTTPAYTNLCFSRSICEGNKSRESFMSNCYCLYSCLSSEAIWLYDPHPVAGAD